MRYLVTAAKRLATHTAGATMVEYALLLALIVLVCVGVMAALGQRVLNLYDLGSYLPS